MTTQDPRRGLLISHLHDQFWSRKYYRAARLVRSWKADHGRGWAGELFRRLESADELPEAERKRAVRTNDARRFIKSCFRKTQQLCTRGFLTEDDLREHLTMPQRLETLFQIIEPFERARMADYKREMFDFYDALHGGALERPER